MSVWEMASSSEKILAHMAFAVFAFPLVMRNPNSGIRVYEGKCPWLKMSPIDKVFDIIKS